MKQLNHLIFYISAWLIFSALYVSIRFSGITVDPEIFLGISPGTFIMILLISSVLIGTFQFILYEYLFPPRFQRVFFFGSVLLKSFLLLLAFNLTLLIVYYTLAFLKEDYSQKFFTFITAREYFVLLIYFHLSTFLVNFYMQVNNSMGHGTLFKLISGKYHKPKEEERVFMFLDLKSSVQIAEKLGNYDYSRLLQNYFFDISKPIENCKGEIYQYYGDGIIITWKPDDATNNARCISCFYDIKEKIEEFEESYQSIFGVVPEAKAGLHVGFCAVTEIGRSKQQIVYHGDTVNTASRIQDECSKRNSDLIISSDLFERLNLPSEYGLSNLGKIKLKGKEEEVALLEVNKTNS